jgi:hypothetical protein
MIAIAFKQKKSHTAAEVYRPLRDDKTQTPPMPSTVPYRLNLGRYS